MTFPPTDEQAAIIEHDPSRHARVLAGPGTGKSTTMVALLNRLLQENEHLRVRMLTFTRAATAELANKAGVTCDQAGRPSTIHSFAISILLRNPGASGLIQPLRIADSWEHDTIIRPTLAARAGVGVRKFDRLEREMSSNWESLTNDTDCSITEIERTRFRGAWNEHRRVLGYTLLSELPYELHRALRDHDDLDGIDFDLLIVDEYQDLNACDLGVLRMLSEKGGCTIIGTGDDDQSIYSWRKANPEGIRRFCEDYLGADDYTLSVTLRCGRKIIEWANYIIQADPDRPATRACLDTIPNSPRGEVALLNFAGDKTEAMGIADIVEILVGEGVSPKHILILMRTDYKGTFSTPIRKALEQRHIYCSDPGYVLTLLEDKENRRLLEMLRLLADPFDSISWAAVVHLLRGVGKRFFDYTYEYAKENGRTFANQLITISNEGFPGAPPATSRIVTDAMATIRSWLAQTSAPAERPEEGWGSWILNLADTTDSLPKPLAEFRTLLVNLDELTAQEQSLGMFLAQIEPLGKDIAQSQSEGVRIMTMGSSKGLTVRATIIAGCEDGVIPRPESNLSEERRILYVAMTRSTEYLFCTWAGRRRGPTARAGGLSLERRRHCDFFNGGPVASTDGQTYTRNRLAEQAQRPEV